MVREPSPASTFTDCGAPGRPVALDAWAGSDGAEALPTASVAVAVVVMVPSASERTSIPVSDQPPALLAVVDGVRCFVPSVMFSWITLPGSALPERATEAAFAALTGLVIAEITGFAGATASLVLVLASDAGEAFDAASLATAVALIVPSL